MANKVINGQNGPVEGTKISFSLFFGRLSRFLRRYPQGYAYYYDGKYSFTMVRTYFDPYSGMPMIGCEKEDSIFSISAQEVYNDKSVDLLLSDIDNVFNGENDRL